MWLKSKPNISAIWPRFKSSLCDTWHGLTYVTYMWHSLGLVLDAMGHMWFRQMCNMA
jgi:hypothetical protein